MENTTTVSAPTDAAVTSDAGGGNALHTDAIFFLREVAAMLAAHGDTNRRTVVPSADAATAKTVAAFAILGPDEITADTTNGWLLERYTADSSRKGYDFLSSVLRGFTPGAAKDLLYAGAGPGRFVVVTALGRTVDKVLGYKFTQPETLLGPGWHAAPLFAAVPLTQLKDYLDEEAVRPDGPLGERVLAGALRAVDRRRQS